MSTPDFRYSNVGTGPSDEGHRLFYLQQESGRHRIDFSPPTPTPQPTGRSRGWVGRGGGRADKTQTIRESGHPRQKAGSVPNLHCREDLQRDGHITITSIPTNHHNKGPRGSAKDGACVMDLRACIYIMRMSQAPRAQEQWESRGGRPGLPFP